MSASSSVTRRRFIRSAAASVAATPLLGAASRESHQATGTRVGEVTDTTAIVWTRLTQQSTRNNAGVKFAMEKGKN